MILASLAATRLGEADVPGPWPQDAIGARLSGWRVSGSIDEHLVSQAGRVHASGVSAFDDPEAFGDCTEPGYGDVDWNTALPSTAPPSDGGFDDNPFMDLDGDHDLGDPLDGPQDCVWRDADEGQAHVSTQRHGAPAPGLTFIPSVTFTGAVEAMVFKTGEFGTGYYVDAPPCGERPGGAGRAAAGNQAMVLSLCDLLPSGSGGQPELVGEDCTGTARMPTPAGRNGGSMDSDADQAAQQGSRRPGRSRGRRRRAGADAFTLPTECLLADDGHKTAGVWAVDAVNPNAWVGVSGHAKGTAADVVVAQEVRKRGKGRLDAERQLRSAGWRFAINNADLTDAGRLSAGVGVGARSHLGMADGGEVDYSASMGGAAARYMRKWIGAMCRGGVHVGSVYLRTNEGLTDANLNILQDIATDLAALTGPWILGGDWNVTPEALAASGWLSLVGGQVVAPAAATCNGKVYDYFVISDAFKHAVIGATTPSSTPTPLSDCTSPPPRGRCTAGGWWPRAVLAPNYHKAA